MIVRAGRSRSSPHSDDRIVQGPTTSEEVVCAESFMLSFRQPFSLELASIPDWRDTYKRFHVGPSQAERYPPRDLARYHESLCTVVKGARNNSSAVRGKSRCKASFHPGFKIVLHVTSCRGNFLCRAKTRLTSA
jgi:hypothetical protein